MIKPERRSKSTYNKHSYTNKLSKILEDPQEMYEDHSPITMSSRKHKSIIRSKLILPSLYEDKSLLDIDFFQEWLANLSYHRPVYTYLTSQAFSNKILSRVHSNSRSTLSQSEYPPHFPSEYISQSNLLDPAMPTESVGTPSKSINLEQKLVSSLQRNSVILNNSQVNHRLSAVTRSLNLDKNNPAVIDKFREIMGNGNNITKENFKEHLMRRYPSEIIEILLKWVYHGLSANFEGWVADMQKLLNLPDEKYFKLAFEIYDFNRDKFICSNDAFHAVTLEENKFFTDDLIRIRNQFLIQNPDDKKNDIRSGAPETPKAKKFKPKHLLEEKRHKKPTVLLGKPEALNFESFCKIKFKQGKPQIIYDIISYLTSMDIYDGKYLQTITTRTRKNSADLVFEMIDNFSYREELRENKRYSYYIEIEKVIRNYDFDAVKILIDKFNKIRSDSVTELRFLSLDSTMRIWPLIFGSDNEYITRSFYNFLSGAENSNISTLRYLNKIHEAIEVNFIQDKPANMFAFQIYDRNKDGAITCDELNELFNSLPQDSYIYKECLM